MDLLASNKNPQNFFTLFGMEESYLIDIKILDQKYFTLLGKYHPDKALSSEDKIQYINFSSVINDAYKTLLDDFDRAAHLLLIHGINIKDDALSPKLPIEMLEEILSMQEEAESANRSAILEKAILHKSQLIKDLAHLFKTKNYKEAAFKAIYLKYMNNIH
ncbi:MAG UNVERIFIED_CONTAM: Fe-S protein assembly co-chaperone HscB [Rickettsiaceae bacterium]